MWWWGGWGGGLSGRRNRRCLVVVVARVCGVKRGHPRSEITLPPIVYVQKLKLDKHHQHQIITVAALAQAYLMGTSSVEDIVATCARRCKPQPNPEPDRIHVFVILFRVSHTINIRSCSGNEDALAKPGNQNYCLQHTV